MTELTQEQIIERGLAAASLLSDETFKSIVHSLTVECFAQFTETEPEEKQRREDSYFQYKGLKAIEAELRARVQAKEQVVAKLDASNEDQSDLDGPILIQGDTDR